MSNHCEACDGVVPEWGEDPDGNPVVTGSHPCPGCQESERLHAELLSVRESLLRERAGQVKCNAGHVSDRALWDCPVCVEAMRARLAKAERVCDAVARCEQGRGRFSTTLPHDGRCGFYYANGGPCTCGGDEYQDALAAWERGNG